jgi:GLPGLI family protein
MFRFQYLLLFALFILSQQGFTQSLSQAGVVSYKVLSFKNEESAQSNILNQVGIGLSPHLQEIVKQFKFELHFSNYLSGFSFVESRIKASNDDIRNAQIAIGYSSYKWQDKNKAYSKATFGFGKNAEDILIVVDKTNMNWVISQESKEIGGYTCFKATLNEVIERSNRNFIRPVVAWFTPEIPIPFGPLHYGNLPGLIMELQTENALYGVEKISFKTKPEVKSLPDLPQFTDKQLYDRLRN